MRKRKGFALAMVLIVMIFIIGISAVIMDMTTNYVGSSQSTIDHQKLYNAAQSGIEWGKAILFQNADDLFSDQLIFNNTLESILSRVEDGTTDGDIIDTTSPPSSDPNISLSVVILDCNYDPNGFTSEILPPVVLTTPVDDGSSGETGQVGFSNILDPNRNIAMGSVNDFIYHSYVIRSVAQIGPKSTEIENMVVVTHEQ